MCFIFNLHKVFGSTHKDTLLEIEADNNSGQFWKFSPGPRHASLGELSAWLRVSLFLNLISQPPLKWSFLVMNVVTRVGLYEFEDKPENVLGSGLLCFFGVMLVPFLYVAGSFATVFKGKHSRLGTIVAIKRVDLTGRSDRYDCHFLSYSKMVRDKKYLNQEVGVMERVNHPNIIRLHYRQVDFYSGFCEFISGDRSLPLLGSRLLWWW